MKATILPLQGDCDSHTTWTGSKGPPHYIFSVLLLQMIAYFFQNAVVGFFMWGYGIPVSLHAIILNDAANSLATLTAVTPGGVGVTQTLTTLALADVADPKVVAAYSLTQQLVMTAWSIAIAVVAAFAFDALLALRS